jgi:hypothetical protein
MFFFIMLSCVHKWIPLILSSHLEEDNIFAGAEER